MTSIIIYWKIPINIKNIMVSPIRRRRERRKGGRVREKKRESFS